MSNGGLQEGKVEFKIGKWGITLFGSSAVSAIVSAIFSFFLKNKLALIVSSVSIGFVIFLAALYISAKIIHKILITQFESRLNAKDDIIKSKDIIIGEKEKTTNQLLLEKEKTINEKNITIQQLKDDKEKTEARLLQERADFLKEKELRIEDLKSENTELRNANTTNSNNLMQLISAQPRPKDIAGAVFEKPMVLSYKDPTGS